YDQLKKRWEDPALDDEDKAYAIPEFFGRTVPRALYAKCDQYLLGLIGYHMITGKLPIRVDGTAVPASASDFKALTAIGDFENSHSCPEMLALCIMRMASIDPADRFGTLEEALDRLEQFRDEVLTIAKDSYRRITAKPDWKVTVFRSFYDVVKL